MDTAALRMRFSFLKLFNSLSCKVLPLVGALCLLLLHVPHRCSLDLRSEDASSMAALVRRARRFLFTSVKRDYVEKVRAFVNRRRLMAWPGSRQHCSRKPAPNGAS
jgi:hypothetical protein